jgi:hypothetical protein
MVAAFFLYLRLQFVFAFGVEEALGEVVIFFGDEDLSEAVEVAVIGEGGVNELLGADDAVFFEHHEEELGVDDGAGVEEFHRRKDRVFSFKFSVFSGKIVPAEAQRARRRKEVE